MRNVDACRHRANPRMQDGVERADCMLLGKTLGVSQNVLASVSRNSCEACCKDPLPTKETPNGMTAALLIRRAETIVGEEGAEGCTASQAEQLIDWAHRFLPVIKVPVHVKRNPYQGFCFYIGEATGDYEKCSTCRGNVRFKVFRCEHEDHGNTTDRRCRTCLDYEPRLGQDTVKSWAVGMQTAPRPTPTLLDTLDSLSQAGWSNPVLFAEPESMLPSPYPQKNIVRRSTVLGAWSNWLLGLQELVLRAPDVDAYLMCQDDVMFSRNLRHYLQESLWPSSKLGVVSLYCPSHRSQEGKTGFFQDDPGWDGWGALAYVFSNASARALLRHPSVVNHRHRGPGEGMKNIDSVVGEWCREAGMPLYYHAPSLARHTGETSTLNPAGTCEGKRQSSNFATTADSATSP